MKHFINITAFCLLWSALFYGQLSPNSAIEATSTACSDLAIQLKAPNGNNTFYAISFCNIGEATAENSYIEVYLDSDLSIVQATQPLQYKSDNIYRFLIGDVAAGACGSMYFQIPQSLIKAHCLHAFAATALPCTTAPIHFQTIRCSEDDGDATPNDNGGFTLTQAELDLTPTGVGAGSYSDPIFEDHVFLDFVPTWDSLMRMFSDLQTYSFDPNDTSTTDSSNFVVTPIGEDLPVHAMASYCRQQAATSSSTLSHNTGAVLMDDATGTTVQEEITTAALSIEEEKEILLSPNPVRQEARLDVIGYEAASLQLEVYSVVGQQVGYFESNSDVLFFQVNQWDKGIYFYRLYANGQVIRSDRFVVE